MSAALKQRREEKVVRLQLPRKLAFLLEMHPYKVAYGGRSSLKSWSFARALLTLGVHQDLRILCAREIQKSLTESVHQLLKDQITALGYEDRYEVTENAIRGIGRDTLFRFTGLSDQTATSVKSFEGFDILWVEEAQAVTKRSWQIALPTIFRTVNSEVWVSFNPDMDSDETWERFVVNPPPGAVVVEMNWRDAVSCGWMSEQQERLRQYDLIHSKNEYANIWDGKPRTVVAGAIYATEVIEMITEKRYRPVPYDPRLPVHRAWDLGWNDRMVVVMVQKPHPSALNVINYMEESHITYASMIAAMDRLGYKWGTDWLPHDAIQHHPTSGTNAKKTLEGLGCRVQLIGRSDPEARIKAGRMMFPRLYVDNSKFDTPPERPERLLGAAHLMERLKRYKRNVPTSTGEPTGPTHDINSHACFTGDTKVLTRNGTRQIKDLPNTGEVLTLCGWKAYLNPRITRRNAPLVEVLFGDGSTVRCTPDHLFLTVNGWKSVSVLQKGSLVRSSLTRSPNISGAISTSSIAARSIGRGAAAGSIAIYGRQLLVRSLRDVTSIIGTIALRIMTWPTWSACQPAYISLAHGMSPTAADSMTRRDTLLPAPERQRQHGTHQRQGAYGTVGMRKKRKVGGDESGFQRLACAAVKTSWGWLRALTRRNTAPSPVNMLIIKSVENLAWKEPVWCLTVPDGSSFSLANGAIVHNCDAFGGLAEIVDRIRNEGEMPAAVVAPFRNADASMGLLG